MKKDIREFIYLDIERLKSIFSQVEEGLLERETKTKGNDTQLSGEVGTGKVLEFLGLDAKGAVDLLMKNQETETRTLHDHMYNYIEKKLIEEELIIKIHESEDIEKYWKKGKLNEKLDDKSFILVKGKVKIEDYNNFIKMTKNINELQTALGVITSPNMPPLDYKIKQWDVIEQQMEINGKLLNKSYLKGLLFVLENFYRNRITIKSMPFSKNVDLNFIGNININFLRESIESIIFKYGLSPVSEWYVFGQISTIFPENYDPDNEIKDTKYKRITNNYDKITSITNLYENFEDIETENMKIWNSLGLTKDDFYQIKSKSLEVAFENVFKSFDGVYRENGVKFPSVTFSPIAIYRN
ncbi:DUF6414 family protein [Methanobrevibacter sp.]|uniref:DUF6414 family protein n=1 Tax=Methanobrevibacter sp. TaxID=66852 RepID=UPI00260464AC|nr:hypothetical protein [uncultured Methanobrevibacter sp.]